MKWVNHGEHWEFFIRPDGYVTIRSKTVDEGVEELEKRSVYNEMKELMEMIEVNGYRGWITDTKITFPGMMRILAKLGARPYAINEDNIYFVKEK